MLVKLDHETPSRGEHKKYLKPPVRKTSEDTKQTHTDRTQTDLFFGGAVSPQKPGVLEVF